MMIETLLGTADWREIVANLHKQASPAAMLARVAPVLTAEAAYGARWAVDALSAEMELLAATTHRHLERHLPGPFGIRIALSGGVWISDNAAQAFTDAITRLGQRSVHITRSTSSTLDGAVRFAESIRP
jgi:hypothetical protein